LRDGHLFSNIDAAASEIMEAAFAKVRTEPEPVGGNPVAISRRTA
jgi:hypothetical protein